MQEAPGQCSGELKGTICTVLRQKNLQYRPKSQYHTCSIFIYALWINIDNSGNFHESVLAKFLLFNAKRLLAYKVNFNSTLITMSTADGDLYYTNCGSMPHYMNKLLYEIYISVLLWGQTAQRKFTAAAEPRWLWQQEPQWRLQGWRRELPATGREYGFS